MNRRTKARRGLFLLACVFFAAIPAHAQGTWTFTGSLNTLGGSPDAVVLLDGSVLAMGDCSASIERYANGVWSPAGFLSAPQCDSELTLLPTGRVLVTSGDTVEIYDPATATATLVAPMNTPRSAYTTTLLRDGRVLVTGGRNSSGAPLSTTEFLDPITLTWAAGPPMPVNRWSHSAILLPNGNVMVTVGHSTPRDLNSTHLFDPISNTWRASGDIRFTGGPPPLTFVPNGRILFEGQFYDITTGTWTFSGQRPPVVAGTTVVPLTNGKILFLGGRPEFGDPYKTAVVFDPATGIFSGVAGMNLGRSDMPAVLLDDNKVLAIGSSGGLQVSSTKKCELYDPGTTNPAPTLNSSSPSIVSSGATTSVLLSGSNFLPNSIVKANGVRLVTQYMGSEQLLAFLPASLLTVRISLQMNVTNAGPGGGTSASRAVSVVTPIPAPALTSVSPGSLARVPTSSVTLTLTGSNFTGSSIVYFNSLALQTTFVSPTRLTAVVPPNTLAPGGADILVFNPDPDGYSSRIPFIVVGRWKDTGASRKGTLISSSTPGTLLADGRVWVAETPSAIFDPVSSKWTNAASVPTRFGQTATLLADGRVLVVGGADSPISPSSSSASLYDPTTNLWGATGSMSLGRSHHTATLLSDGRVLVVGGTSFYSGSGALQSSEVYDPTSGTWGTVRATNLPRMNHTATRLTDGTVLVAGGRQGDNFGYLASVQSYDPASNSWRELASMNSARSSQSATVLLDGRLLVTGGRTANTNLATAELYNPRTNLWTSTSPMNAILGTNTAARLQTGYVLVFGSASEIFDPETGTWITTGPPNDAGAQGTVLSDGRALKFGGEITEIFEPASALPVWQPFSITDRGGVSVLSSPSSSTVSVGYATVVPAGNSSTPAGIAIFGYRSNGVLLTETGVPGVRPMQSGRVHTEISDAVNTGFAFANPGNIAATITFHFTNLAGGHFDSGSFVLSAGENISVFLNQAPFNGSLNGKGTFTFGSSVPVAAAAFRGTTNERGDFLIATVPVIDLDAPVSTSALIFPTFADGGGWITQVVLVNPGGTVLNGTLQFFSQSGTVISSSAYSIPANASATVQTSGLSASPVAGSIQAIPAAGTSAPQGFVIFSFSRNGVKVTEAGVTALALSTAFRMYAESSPQPSWIQSGVAVANPWAAPTTVTLEVTRLDGSSTGLTGTLSLPAKGQITRFLSEIPGLEALPATFQGVVRVSSSVPISAMGLRGRYNERQDFLYTTTPPVDETAPPTFTPLYFPQIVNSGGYTTQFILFSGSAGQAATGGTRIIGADGEGWQLH